MWEGCHGLPAEGSKAEESCAMRLRVIDLVENSRHKSA